MGNFFNKKSLRGSSFLIIASFFWGSSFIAQRYCKDYPFSTNTLRFLFACLFMIPIILIYNIIQIKKGKDKNELKQEEINSIKGGLISGISLALATTLQQLGMTYGTSAGKSGFLTSLYMIFIPLIGLFFNKKFSLSVWIGVIIAIIGASLISLGDNYTLCIGDVLTIGCAFLFAINVLCVDNYVKGKNPIIFSFFHLLSAGIICSISLIIVNITGFEVLTGQVFKKILFYVLYVALFSCCLAYTCQIIGQKNTSPAVAGVLMSLESVFALIFGLIILNESFSWRTWVGIVFVFISVILVQIDISNNKNKINE